MEDSMPELLLQSNGPAAAAGTPLPAPERGPSRPEIQFSQIGHIALKPAWTLGPDVTQMLCKHFLGPGSASSLAWHGAA